MAFEPRRVLFLVPSFAGGGGGAERVFSILLKHLDRTRFELHLAVAQPRNAQLLDIPADVHVHDLGISRMRYAAPGIVRLAWRIKPHVILATVVYLNVMLLLSKPFMPRGIRLLVREAIMPSAFLQQETSHPNIWKWFYRNLYKKADRIVCLSDSMMRDFAEHFAIPAGKLVRIYNPVDIEQVRTLASQGQNPFSSGGPHLVTLGRLQKQKGIDVLLDALPQVLAAFPRVHLTILGEGPLENELKKQANRLNLGHAVTFAGFQPNPWPYVKHCDLFVLASRFEGLPNALLEVLALGKRVVVTDCPGGIREIRSAVGSMRLVPSEDSKALAAAIVEECGKLPEALGPQDLTKFDLQTAIRGYTDLLV